MDEWQGFFAAEVGASAALSGLLLVGMSINLSKILSVARLPNRGLVALLLLITVLTVCSLLLVPGQPLLLIGSEVLVIGLVVWATVVRFDVRAWRSAEAEYRRIAASQMAINQLAVVPYIIGGATILLQGLVGIYWLVPAILVSNVKAVLDAWVLLIEIDR